MPAAAAYDDRYFAAPTSPGPRVAMVPAPSAIVDQGRIQLGQFAAPVRQMNLRAATLLRGRFRGWPRPLLLQWVGAGLAHPDWYIGMIVVDADIAALAVVYGVERATGQAFSHDLVAPRSRVHVAESTWNDRTSFAGRGARIDIEHRLEEGQHRVRVDVPARGRRPAVTGDLIWHEPLDRVQPLVLMSPLAGRGFIYNHRAQMPIAGQLHVGERALQFDPGRDIANLDEVKIHGRTTSLRYRWFNGAGFDARGRLVGFDFAWSPQKPDPTFNENCLWVGDRLWLCDEVRFEFDRRDLMRPWRARDASGRVDLTFYPEGGKAVKFGPLGAYHQKCGHFRGTIVDPTGEAHHIDDYAGCAECADVLARDRPEPG